jgi:hypothetical protein
MISELPPVAAAAQHTRDILTLSVKYKTDRAAVVLYDGDSALATLLAAAYAESLPSARHLRFHDFPPAEILRAFASLVPGDLVVLVQSTSFRLASFRIRTELVKRGVKVVEHANLGRMSGDEIPAYVDSLAYDPDYFRGVGDALKERIDRAALTEIDSGGELLIYDSPFESAKLNTGDFANLKNAGSGFPIGEVFTEARDLERVNGRVRVFAFADLDFFVRTVAKPITLTVVRGRVTEAHDSTPEFDLVLSKIRAHEGEVWVRELGFGLNRAFSPSRIVSDVGAYERVCGIHLSLGAKHGVFKKPALPAEDARFHVDVFPVTERVTLDGDVVFQDGAWTV